MSHITTDFIDLFNTYFQKPYIIPANTRVSDDVINGINIKDKDQITGREVFLPVILRNSNQYLKIACATIRTSSKKTIIRTVVSERSGTIKEQFQTGDWVFNIKGVLISKTRGFPTADVTALKELYESRSAVYLDNAVAELFMPGNNRVVIESIEFAENEGKNIRFKPFTMVCESDFIDTLTLK